MQAAKRALFLLIALVIAFTAGADERSEKRRLVSELLEVIDAKALLQTSFDSLMTTVSGVHEGTAADVAEESRAEWEENRRAEVERMRDYQQRMFAQIDYVRYFDEVYAPIFEKQFTADELSHLIEFFGTKHGQKLAKVLPEFGLGAALNGMTILSEAADAAQKEIVKEEAAKYPWRGTMSDLRTLATAVEARATDENEYPDVTFEQLEALITPTYIRVVPKVDSWGTPYVYVGNGEHYRFVSAGADKRFEWSARHLDLTITEPKFSESLDADIIFQDGTFIQSPKAANQ